MKIKTETLTGRALNWAVATAKGIAVVSYQHYLQNKGYDRPTLRNLLKTAAEKNWLDDLTDAQDGTLADKWTTRWDMTGPILDLEKIGFAPQGEQWVAFYMEDNLKEYDWQFKLSCYGSTALIAAMRCYVACKLGEFVDVPEWVLL